jgi:hypothetical protein
VIDLQVMEALEDGRPCVEFEPDWGDVIGRARVSRTRRRPCTARRPRLVSAACGLLLLTIVAAATPAIGLRGRLLSFFDVARSPRAVSTWRLAGPPEPASGALLAAARLTHVDSHTLRRVAVGGSGYRRVALVGGIGPDRRPWLAQVGPGWVSNFFPLFGQLAEVNRPVWHTKTAHGWDGWEFPMYGRGDEARAVFSYVAYGGPEPASVSWATVVGFVRSDVSRLVVTTVDGKRRHVPLTRTGGYAYATAEPSALPREVTAVDAAGRPLGRERFRLQTLAP